MQQATIHVAMFMELLAAQQAGNEKLAKFYVERFPPDVRKAYDAWMAQKPFENPKADPHPFVPNLYEVRGTREAAEANAQAASSLQASRNNSSVSGQYLANTVLFATVLFFASASGKFEQRRVRVVAFAFAVAHSDGQCGLRRVVEVAALECGASPRAGPEVHRSRGSHRLRAQTPG